MPAAVKGPWCSECGTRPALNQGLCAKCESTQPGGLAAIGQGDPTIGGFIEERRAQLADPEAARLESWPVLESDYEADKLANYAQDARESDTPEDEEVA